MNPKWYVQEDIAGYWFGLTKTKRPEFMIPRQGLNASAHVKQVLAALNEQATGACSEDAA